MPRIKITQPGWAGFTGHIGITEFKDGVSTDSVNRREIAVIGASLTLVVVDEDGHEGVNPALQHQMLTDGTMTLRADVLKELPRASETETAAVTPKRADPDAIVFHTKEQLEEVAEKKGIHGLREIMEPLHLKASSINKAIQVILKEELKLKAQLETAGKLQREDAVQPVETPNEVVEGEQSGEQTETPSETASQESQAKRSDAGPGTEQTEA